MIWRTFSLVGLILIASSPASSAQTVRWDRIPIPVQLFVGQERILLLDRSVRVGIPQPLRESLTAQSTGGALYLTADSEFSSTRVQIQYIGSGALILLDVSATTAEPGVEPLDTIRIVTPPAIGAEAEEAIAPLIATRGTPIPIVLTRYAAQRLYAPARAVEPLPGVIQVSDAAVPSNFISAFMVQAQPLGTWRLSNYWLTAIEIRNASTTTITLDPRLLQGRLTAATFHHNALGPRGSAADTTVVYVVTRGETLSSAVDGLAAESGDRVDAGGHAQ